MPITPDTKDWTWVIETPCTECGFDASVYRDRDVPAAIRTTTDSWPAVLKRADVRVRPNDSTWSALEYAAHVRDVLRIYRERLRLMLIDDDPLYANWDQDAAAVAERYNEQDPVMVAAEVLDAGAALAEDFEGIHDEAWQRPGRRSDGATFTVSTISRYLLHDLIHHQGDVRG